MNKSILAATLLPVVVLASIEATASNRSTESETRLTGEKAIAHLRQTGSHQSLATAVTAARYGIHPSHDPESGQSKAVFDNPSQGLRGEFNPQGLNLRITSRQANIKNQTYGVTWRLLNLGYGDSLQDVPQGRLTTAGQRVEITRQSPSVTEWFVNRANGLEHGFTLPSRPTANPDNEPLILNLSVAGDLTPVASPGGQFLELRNRAGQSVATYSKLKVWDSTGTELPAAMKTEGTRVILNVADRNAVYPLTIDPTIAQEAYAKASNAEAGDKFGWAIAISGNTAVVGAPEEDSNGDPADNSLTNSGAVYVFIKSGSRWIQQAYLKASNADAGDQFGYNVAISGDSLVASAIREDSSAVTPNGNEQDNGAINSGAAYVFVRNGSNWLQQAYLKANNSEANDFIGFDVAIDGDTIVIGSLVEDSDATGVNGDGSNNNATDSGAAYVFVRQGTNWSQQAYLKASNTENDDNFGRAVSVSGDIIAVGAFGEDSGANGINGNQADNATAASGAAYVYRRTGSNWVQEAYLKASNPDVGDNFGSTLAVSGNSIVVGSDEEDSSATGINGNQNDNSMPGSGAAYIFTYNGATWVQEAYIKASNPDAGDYFGDRVDISGDKLLIGALWEDSSSSGINGNQMDNSLVDSGAAYVFQRSGATWTQRAYLKASNPSTNDWFGSGTVAISQDTAVVGAHLEASNAVGVDGNQSDNSATNSGAAYLFFLDDFIPPPTVVSTLAGNGSNLGDNIPVADSRFAGVRGLALDSRDNIYVADEAGNRVRIINATNRTISTVAGTGAGGFSGDGGPAILAEINGPRAISIDKFRNRLVIPDRNNERVRQVNLTTGTISTVAGNGTNGFAGDGGPAVAAELNEPFASIVRLDGTIFFTDRSNHSVRRVDASGLITTVAGTGTAGYSGDGGPASAAMLNNPGGLAFDLFSNLIIADTRNHRIRRVELQNGVISTIAGTGAAGYAGDGGLAADALLNRPNFPAFGPDGSLYFTEELNHVIRKIDKDTGIIRTFAGSGVAGFAGDGGDALDARFNRPAALEFDTRGDLLVADRNNRRIRKIQLLPASTFDFQNLQPGQSIPLFTNNYLFHFAAAGGGPVPWTLADSNVLEVVPGTGSLVTTQAFNAFHLHAEFRTLNNGQNGNSGLFLQGRYEVQIFNSFGKSVLDNNDCGAIWGQTPPPTNACLAPDVWQTYEITFHPPQWNGTNKVRNARATVALNGILLHQDVDIPSSTQAGNVETNLPGPILLQDNGSAVQFRNIVVTPFDTAPRFERLKSFPGNGTEHASKIVQDQDGNVYLAGKFDTDIAFGTNLFTASGTPHLFVAKLDPSLTPLWTRTLPVGGSATTIVGLDVDSAGNVFACGDFSGSTVFDSVNLNSAGSSDALVLKLDAGGSLVWARLFGETLNDGAHDLDVDQAGNVYVVGDFKNSATFGTTTFTNQGSSDLFLTKIAPDGAISWTGLAKGTSGNYNGRVGVTPDGTAYVTGVASGNTTIGSINLPSFGGTDIFVAKFTPEGAPQWAWSAGGTGEDVGQEITAGPNGEAILVGEFRGATAQIGSTTLTNMGDWDGFVARIHADGTVDWVRQLASPGTDQMRGAGVNFNGDINVGGNFGGNLLPGGFNAFNATTNLDVFVAQFSATGQGIWANTISGPDHDFMGIANLFITPGGKLLTSGSSRSAAISGNALSLSRSGPQSLFLAELSIPVSQLLDTHWRFDEPTGEFSTADTSGRFNGSLSTTGAVLVAAGFSTNAVALSRATNGYVSFGNVPITGRDPLTFSVTVRLVPGNTNHMVVLSRHDTRFGTGFILGLNGMGTNHVPGKAYFTESGRYENALFSQVDVNDGRWHTLLVTYEPFGRKALYVDGIFQGFSPAGLIPPTASPLVAGGLSTGGVPIGAYEGLIDELVVYRRILDPDEISIQAIYPDEAIEPFILPEFAWARQITASTNIQSEAVARDSQGNIYVTGWFEGQADFGGTNVITSSGFADMFLAKYDNDGNLLWLKQGGGSQHYDGGTDLAVDSQDNIIVVGNYGRTAFFEGLALVNGGGGGFGGGGGGNFFGRGGFVAKYNSAGTIILLKDGWGNISGVDVDSGDSIYIAGDGRLNTTIENRPLLSFGGNDLWIAKYTAFGTVAWVINYGSSGSEELTDIRLDQADNIYIAGQYNTIMTIGSQTLNLSGAPANPRLPFLIKLNSGTGAPIWALRGNGTAFGDIQSIAIDPLNRPNVVGNFVSSLNYGTIRLTNNVTSGYRAVFNENGLPLHGSPYHDDTRSIAINGSDNIYLWGNFNGVEPVGTNTLSSIGGEDTVLLKVNDAGTNQLIRQVRSTDDDFAALGKGVAVDPPGNVYVTGHSTATNNNPITFGRLATGPTQLPSAWLAKIPSEVQIIRSPTHLVATNLDTTFFRVMPAGAFPFSYRWYHNGTNLVPGGDGAILRLTNLALALPGSYHVIVSNSAGFAVSQPALLSLALPPVIQSQPQDVTVALNRTATFGVVVGGIGPFAYQWFFQGTNSLADATNANFTVSNITTNDEGSYHVVISNQFGASASDTARLATFPEGVLPEVITQATGATNPVGSFISFNITAGGQTPLFYQWYRNGAALAGRTQPFLQLFNLQLPNTGNYTVIVTNLVGSVTSAVARLQVFLPVAPVITNQPQSQTALVGANVSFSVGVSGSPVLRYQWKRNNSDIPGATGPVLNLSNVQLSDAGNYEVQVFNDVVPAAASTPVTLTVQQPPFIVTPPQTIIVSNAQPTNLVSVIGGSPPPAIQWFRDGVLLQDGTEYLGVRDATLSILSAGVSDIGSYFVTATNAAGAVTSAPAALILDFPPQILTHPVSVDRPAGSNHTFSIIVTGAPPMTLQWRFMGQPIPDAITNLLSLTNLGRANSGFYDVAVANASGSLTSSNARLRVIVPQRINVPTADSNRFRFTFGESDGSALVATNLPPFEVQLTTNFNSWHSFTNAAVFTNGQLSFEDILPPALHRRYYRIIEP